jgi:hypothetical protein
MTAPKNPHAVALGRRGGIAGGWRKWFDSLTPEQQQAHQRKAAAAAVKKRKQRKP